MTQNQLSVTSDQSSAKTDGAVSTVAFIAGGVLLATGAIVFFTGGHRDQGASQAPAIAVAPAVGPGQAGLLLGGAF